ncbi:MAG: hypothetical protein F4Y41_04570 [Gammaproteobacteria bacterium]|nr:hypothetical protein [Gammaproteobacteria bacterium]
MSLRAHGFSTFAGPWTRRITRPLVITRYTLSTVFSSRLFTIFFVACFLPSCLFLVSIYLRYKLDTLTGFFGLHWGPAEIRAAAGFLDDWLYSGIVGPSLWVTFLIVLVRGPALLGPDLKDNAMPLYLSRPVTKLQYLVGKLLVLLWLTATVTWIPGLLLVFVNAYYAEDGWLLDNLSVPLGLVATCLVWSGCLSIIALALSAWVRWRPAATLGFLGLFVIGSAVGNLFRVTSGDWYGSLIILWDAIEVVGRQLFGAKASDLMPLPWAWGTLAFATALAFWALMRRIRAFEIVR